MITGIVVAIIGSRVFPDQTHWFIAYAVTTAIISLIKFIIFAVSVTDK